MTAGSTHCYCETCGVVCEGRFAGCAEVWARGPKDVSLIHPRVREATHVETATHAAVAVESEFVNGARLDELVDADFGGSHEAVPNGRSRSSVPDVVPSRAVVDDRMVQNLVERIGEQVDERVRAALEQYRGEVERAQPAAPMSEADVSRLGDVSASIEEGCRVLLTALDGAGKELRESLADLRSLAFELREGLQGDAGSALKDSVGEIQEITFELRQELAQLAAFRRALSEGYPAVARAVEHASVKAATRFAELTRSISELTPTAAAEPNGHAIADNGVTNGEGADSPTNWS